MPNHKMSSAFITCTLPREMPSDFDRHAFYSLLSTGLRAVAPAFMVLSVLETGEDHDNLHLHYAVEWPKQHGIWYAALDRLLKGMYSEHTKFELQPKTFTIVKVPDFYSLVGGYLAKEDNREVLYSYGLNETELARGALRHEKHTNASDKKRSNQTKTEAFYDCYKEWDELQHFTPPRDMTKLVARIVAYGKYAIEEDKAPFPLATQFASRGIVYRLAARYDVPNRHLEHMLTHMLDLL